VSDSEWPVCATTSAVIVAPSVNSNLPPFAHLDAVSPNLEYVNRNITFNLTVSDPEGDGVYVTWAFGDGAAATNYTTGTATAARLHQTHLYASAGTYTMRVVYSDNKTGVGAHTRYINATLDISTLPGAPPVSSAANPWINYGVPILVVAIVAIVVGIALVRRRRAAKKDETLGEVLPPQGPPPPRR
jgi:hypothetical protein